MGYVNLIPMERLVRRRRKARLCRWVAVCGAYVVLLIAGTLLLRVLHATEDRSVTQQLTAANQRVEEGNKMTLELRRELAEATMALETTRAIREQPNWSKLFLRLSNQAGEEIVLSRCQVATFTNDNKAITDGWNESSSAKPLAQLLTECQHKLVLNGFARSQESVSRFVLGLESSGAFDLVRVVNSSRQSFLQGQAVAFNVECQF